MVVRALTADDDAKQYQAPSGCVKHVLVVGRQDCRRAQTTGSSTLFVVPPAGFYTLIQGLETLWQRPRRRTPWCPMRWQPGSRRTGHRHNIFTSCASPVFLLSMGLGGGRGSEGRFSARPLPHGHMDPWLPRPACSPPPHTHTASHCRPAPATRSTATLAKWNTAPLRANSQGKTHNPSSRHTAVRGAWD